LFLIVSLRFCRSDPQDVSDQKVSSLFEPPSTISEVHVYYCEWWDRYPVTASLLAENVLNRASILRSDHTQSLFSTMQRIFELSQWWPSSTCFWLSHWGSVDLIRKRKSSTFVHQILQDIPKGLRSGEYDAHSSAAMKSGVLCHRNCCVTFVWCNGTLVCMKTKSLPG